MERGTHIERPRGASKPDLPPPPIPEKKRKLPQPNPEAARFPKPKKVEAPVSPNVPDLRIVTDKDAEPLAKTEIQSKKTVEAKGEFPKTMAPSERAKQRQETREAVQTRPVVEAHTNAPENAEFRKESGEFVFVAQEDGDPSTIRDMRNAAGQYFDVYQQREKEHGVPARVELAAQRGTESIRMQRTTAATEITGSSARMDEMLFAHEEVRHALRKEAQAAPEYVTGRIIREEISGADFAPEPSVVARLKSILEKGPDAYRASYEELRTGAKKNLDEWTATMQQHPSFKGLSADEILEKYTAHREVKLNKIDVDETLDDTWKEYVKNLNKAFNYYHQTEAEISSLTSVLELAHHTERLIKKIKEARAEGRETAEQAYAELLKNPAAADRDMRAVIYDKLAMEIPVTPENALDVLPPHQLSGERNEQLDEIVSFLEKFSDQYKDARTQSERMSALADLTKFLESDVAPFTTDAISKEALIRSVAEARISIPSQLEQEYFTTTQVTVPEDPRGLLTEPSLPEDRRAAVSELVRDARSFSNVAENLKRDPRFQEFSEAERFITVKRLADSGLVDAKERDDLLTSNIAVVNARVDKGLVMMKIDRTGKIEEVPISTTEKEDISSTDDKGKIIHTLSVPKRKALQIRLAPGDHLVLMTREWKGLFGGREGLTAETLQPIQDTARTPNRSTEQLSRELGDRSGRPNLVLKTKI